VLRFAADRGSDVLHVDDVDVSPRLALALRGRRGVPTILAVHDPKPHSGERNWRKALARRLAYPAASRFVLYSDSLKSEFARSYALDPSNVVTAHLGVYTVFREWATPHAAATPPTVMFFGRVSPYKGLDVFYTAARLIAQRLPGVTFIVAGRPVHGYTPPAPPHLAGSAPVEVIDRYLSSAETALLFQRTSVVVCPYRDATQSGVVLTAYAFRVPVVATAVGGMPEYVTPDKTGSLVPVGDPQAVADAVCRILSEPSFGARLREGIADVEDGDLGWHNTAAVLMDAYSRMARK
jgi:glycosyltransferase involved in cell wall biosynthesis